MPSRQNHYNNSLRLNFATEKESRRNYPTAKSLYKLGPPTLRQFLFVHNTRSALGFGYDLASICFTGVHFMKLLNLKHMTGSLAMGLALGSTQVTPTLLGQSQNQDRNAQQDQEKTQTFVGKIVKARNGQYALLTDE